MKRLTALLLALALLCACAALAEDDHGDMVVVNCDEWVSLRARPDTGSERLAKVPLGATVTDAVRSGDFYYCEYGNDAGYILAKYLEDADAGDAGRTALDVAVNGMRLTAVRDYGQEETLTVTCADAQGVRWTRVLHGQPTELDATAAFLGGTADAPLAMLFEADGSLTACDLDTGKVLWTLSNDVSGLHGGLCWAVAQDGTMYCGGFYGPDPVAISRDGMVLWRADADSEDAYWLYEIRVEDDIIACHYDHLIDEDAGWIYYARADGAKLGIERE